MMRIPADLAFRFSGMLFKNAWWIITIYLVLAVLGFRYTAANLGINSDTSEMFDDQLDFRKARDLFKTTFPEVEDNFVIVVSGQTPELVSSTGDSIAKRLRELPEHFELVYQPAGGEFFSQNQLLFLKQEDLEGLSEKVFRSRPMLNFMMNNYSLKGLFSFLGLTLRFSSGQQLDNLKPLFQQMDSVLIATVEGDGNVMSWQRLTGDTIGGQLAGYSFIQVKPVLDYSKFRPAKPAIETTRKIVDEFNSENTTVRISGKKAMTYEEMGSVMDGAVQASILALVMVSLVLWLGLKSLRLIAATLLTLLVGLVLTASFTTWAVGHLNMISVAFTVLYIGLGVDYAIHICLRYRELHQANHSTRDSMTISINDVGPALLLSTLSTSIGFYAFVPTGFAGVSELGIIAGTGMFISLLVTMTLLPCLIWKLSTLSDKPLVRKPGWRGPNIDRYRKLIRITTIILAFAAVLLLPKASFDYDPINLRNPHSESVTTVRELMNNQEFTPWTLNIVAADREELDRLSVQLKSMPEVGRVIHLYNFIPEQQPPKIEIIDSLRRTFEQVPDPRFIFDREPLEVQVKAIKDFSALLLSPAYAERPALYSFGENLEKLDQADEKSQQRLVDQLQFNLLAALPYSVSNLKSSLQAQIIDYRHLPRSLKQQWQAEDGSLRLQVFPKNPINTNHEMRHFAEAVQSVSPNATGDLMVTIASGDTVVNAFRQAIISALIAITLLLLIYLRNIRDTLYILMPLVLAGVFTGALTVVLGIEFNFANIIALPLLLGLGVDNGVHIVHRSKTERTVRGLLQTSTTRAILFSSLTTLFSFGNLAFSPHRGTASMGWLLTAGVIFVVITTLLVLPAFLPDRTSGD